MPLSPKSYLRAIKQNNFVQALAYCPPALRYQLPKQRWIANRLGLHRTILQQPSILAISKRAKLTKIVSKLKLEALSQQQAKIYIDEILAPKYAMWHLEFIKDIGFKYPELISNFIQNNTQKNSYYLGLYLALTFEKELLKKRLEERNAEMIPNLPQEFKHLLEKLDNPFEQRIFNSNAFCHTPQSKLDNLNTCFSQFGLINLSLKDPSGKFDLENLAIALDDIALVEQQVNHNPTSKQPTSSCVTILVTCYNAQDTISYCLYSLLQQTWQNLEIIVIDDASTDSTCDIVSAIAKHDNRIKLLKLSHNVGTYGAKSLGALLATGKFLTCQDSDDFAHPQKIERQVKPLIENKAIAVTTSYWLRIDKNGWYYVRQYYPFLRQNPASPMFRRTQVQADTGLWHLARTGADSEILERLKLVYGKQAIEVIAEPLTLASHRENSLMTSSEFGAYNHQSAVDRLDYWENWRLWHIDELANHKSLKMPTLEEQLTQSDIFTVPQKIKINKENLSKNLSLFTNREKEN